MASGTHAIETHGLTKPFRYVSLFYWAVGNGQLDQGSSWASFGVLAGVAIVCSLLAVAAFERHDLS
jgi:hypothetical protein